MWLELRFITTSETVMFSDGCRCDTCYEVVRGSRRGEPSAS
ncbi:MAG: hypothetical protein R3Y19_07075 [Rikenellaceae bacterium]